MRRLAAASTALALAGALLVGMPTTALAETPVVPEVNVATVDDHGALHLSWKPAPGATGYTVQLGTDPAFASGTVVAEQSTYALTWVPTTTIDSTDARALYWRVAAHTSGLTLASIGGYSLAQQIDRDALAVPTLLSPADAATITYPSPVTFSWTPVPGAVSYDLQYSSEPSFPPTSVTQTVTTTGTSYSPPALLARQSGGQDITWSWRVRANFYSGTSTPIPGGYQASPFSFGVVWPPAASRPTLTGPADWSTAPAGVSDLRFSWARVAGASKYTIEISKSPTFDDTTLTYDVTGTSFIPELALVDATYYWRVTAYDASGNAGAASATRQFYKLWGTQTAPSNPGPQLDKAYPGAVTGSTDFAAPEQIPFNEFELTWDPIPRATLYEVEVVPTNGDPRLTCRTASTSATIVGKYDRGTTTPDAVKGTGPCLWTSTIVNRIHSGLLYQWRVRAVDYSGSATTSAQSTNPTGSLESQWSDPESVDWPNRTRYFTVIDPPAPTATSVVLDATAWSTQTVESLQGQPAPVFTWAPVDGANVYAVEVAQDREFTTQVGVFRTPSTTMRVNGVFDDNATGLPYYWRVRAETTTNWSQFTAITSWSTGFNWSKYSTATDFVGVAVPADTTTIPGTVLLSWRPQFASAPNDGGSRGYYLTISRSDSTVVGSVKIEYPFYAAKNPTTGKPLPDGDYTFTVAPLDANGNPGRASEPQSFRITQDSPSAATSTVSASSVRLSWSTTAPAVKFTGKYWNTATPATTIAFPAGSTVLSQTATTITDLPAGAYGWYVQSVDTAGNASAPSTAGTFTVLNATVALTTPNDAILPTSDRVLSWDAVPGASRYLVQVATTSGGVTAAKVFETTATSFAYPDTVAFGTTYYWRVRAVPEKYYTTSTTARPIIGESTVGRFSARTTPGAPSQASPVVTGKDVTVSWTALSGAAAGTDAALQYIVRYRPKVVPETSWTQLDPTSGAAASSVVSGLEPGITYQFQVGAVSPEGQGPWSATMEKVTATVPGAPTSLAATPGIGTLALSWSAPSSTGGTPITTYEVRYRTGTQAWATTTTTSRTLTLTGLGKQVPYDVEVAATNAVGTGPAATASFATVNVPGVPLSLKVVRGDTKATVSWAAPSNTGGKPLTGYSLQSRAYNPSTKVWTAWSVIATPGATTTSYVRTGLTNGYTYHFRIAAKSSVGTSAVSAYVSVIPAGKPKAPTSVRVTSTVGKITTAWGAANANGSAVTAYYVQYSTNKTTWTSLAKLGASVRSYTTIKGTKGKTYYFRVIALNAIGLGTPSAVVAVVKK